MAALTGNSISSTYTSLLKVGDNGTLDTALQSITDGAGNTTGLSMNTGGALTATGTITANAFSGPLTGNVTGDLTGNVTGNVTGNITGNVTGNVTGDLTGNASTATALETARTIAGVSFDGTANISLTTDNITEGSNQYYTAERVDDQVNTLVVAGTGISKTYDDANGTLTIANTSPDQTVSLSAGTGISTSGTYPSFTITNTQPDQTVSLTAGTGITVTGTYPSFTIANSGAGIGLTDLSATDAGGLGSFSYDNTTGVFTYTGPSNADVRALISAVDNGGDGSLSYDSSTGVISYTGPSSSEVQAHITKTYVDSLGIAASTADTLSTARTINGVSFDGSANISFDTDSVSEGASNLYYTTARFDTAFGTKDTGDLSEGTNLYYTAERVDDRVANLVVAGTGISSTYDDVNGTLTLANTSPDQTVALTGGTGISTSGTYPNFTITNDSPDQTVALSAGSNVTITGTYPSFTIAATDTNTTYSAGTGLSLSGTTFSLDAGLNNLSDVTLTSPSAGQLLIYDNTNSIFENAALTAGTNITITNADGAITIDASDSQTDSFKTIAVSGQNDVVADSATDTLTLAAGSNVTITTNDSTDTITFAATDTNTTYSAGTGLALAGTTFSLDSGLNNLTDVNITSAAAGNLLIYDATNSYFENALLTAGTGITITNADGAITITNTAVGDNAFGNIAVSGQSTIAADGTNDTLNIAAGSNVTLTTDASTDTLTIAATAGANTIAIDTFTGNGSTAAYTLSNSASSENELSVYFDGVYQLHDSYTVSGTTLTFDTNVPNGTAIEVQHLVSVNLSNVVQSLTGGDGITASASTGDVTLSLSSSTPNAFTMGGNGSTGGVTVDDGSIQIRTGTGNVAEMRFYCEVSNAHYQTLKAQPHSAASSAVLTLPENTGTLVGTGDSGSVSNTMIADDAVSYEKVDAEFTTSTALSAGGTVNVDFDAAQVFTLTPNGNVTLNITNPKIGITKTVIITGSGTNNTLGFTVGGASGTFNKIGGDYDDTTSTKNLVSITCVASTEFWYAINQIAT